MVVHPFLYARSRNLQADLERAAGPLMPPSFTSQSEYLNAQTHKITF